MNADVREMMNYFMRMKDINPNFFYTLNLDEEYKFRSAIWVDARCMVSYEYYRHVVSFDSTYNTNRTSLVQFVHEYDNVLGIKEYRELEDDVEDSKGVIPCATSSPMERQFQQDYITNMFRDVQIEFVKKVDYRVSIVAKEGQLV
ncbi:hypothetical protein Ahy_A09g043491 [Arachis hypogaea]|uniref:Protein FAR1-RELATED SEQUENCE n=1 Tax=Arachis hypogaea TaxID=3818 RepID=A0A445BIG2_ARAHY|nr:hypothetical protein Ahy_A09g043491 [Arachis hypogaea]